MRFYGRKVKHIVPPFILLSLCILVVYSALRWALDLRFGLVQLDEDLWDFWLPFLLPWIPLLTFFRRRFHVLTFKRDDDRGRWMFQVICGLAMAGSMVVAQHYLKGTAGGLKEIERVADIDPSDHVRHYRIARFIVGTWMGGTHGTAHTSGRHNESLNYQVYVVAPLLLDSAEDAPGLAKAWYGVRFHEKLSNRASDTEKETAWRALWARVGVEMEDYDFHDLDHFRRVPASEDRKAFLEAIASRTGSVTGEEVILVPQQERFGSGNGTKLAWIFGSLGIGCGLLLLALVWTGFDPREHERQLRGERPQPSPDELDDWYTWLIPKRGRIVTALLVDLNLIVFIAMVLNGVSFLSPRGAELVSWGANTTSLTLAGEWWRLVTSLFVHAGFMHVMMNLAGLVIAGLLLEPMLGAWRHGVVYLVAGLAGGLASLWWHDQVISVGASGAVFGLFGAVIGISLTHRNEGFDASGSLLLFAVLYAGVNILFGFLVPGIDNAAHIGGLLAGMLAGTALFHTNKDRPQEW